MYRSPTLILLAASVAIGLAASVSDFRQISLTNQNSKRNFDYYISHYRANREQANYDCRHVFSGRLLTILSEEEDQAVSAFIEENSGFFVLTSGSRQRGTNYWYWDSNLAPLNYTNWRPDHPTINHECLCVGGTGARYGWYSVPCTNGVQFICEV